ncbi:hypothetical protein HBI57_143410, partial [Parastagonospora nodorum]
MANNSAPDTPGEGRKRAPTITIDTSAVNPNDTNMTDAVPMGQIQDNRSSIPNTDHNVSPTQSRQSPQELRNANSFESNASRPTSPHNVSSPAQGWNGTNFLAVPGA